MKIARGLVDEIAQRRDPGSMHFALFRMEDGVCIDGTCPGGALDPVPVEVTPGGALRIAGR